MTLGADPEVLAALADCDVTRLVHFTPSKNLHHILNGGIRSSADLAANAPGSFDPTDVARFDRHPDHVCTTFQYPNPYYLRKARQKPDFRHFPDWVCLLIDPSLAASPGALFSESNAATNSGSWLKPGAEALRACFGSPAGSRGLIRSSGHQAGAATDLQAEALLPGPILLHSVRGIVIPTEQDAVQELGRLQLLGHDISRLEVSLYIQADWFAPESLVALIRSGSAPEPRLWSQANITSGRTATA